MRLGIVIFAAGAVSLASSQPAASCSVHSGYKPPDTLDLVVAADVIAIAEVLPGGQYLDTKYRRVSLRPLEVLKGEGPLQAVDLPDAVIAGGDAGTASSDPRNLVDAHPDAFAGSCNRSVFDEGTKLIVFLRREQGKLEVYAPPFSRALEDVSSDDALWVKAVKLYIGIAARPPADRPARMEELRDTLAADLNDADARLLSHELERALARFRRNVAPRREGCEGESSGQTAGRLTQPRGRPVVRATAATR
jgi:hypothetical protein